MSLEKASIVWSAKQLKGMVVNGKINFDHIVQRSYVWERSRKSALIESMIIGYPIPPVFAKRVDEGTGKRGSNIYHIMDKTKSLHTFTSYFHYTQSGKKIKHHHKTTGIIWDERVILHEWDHNISLRGFPCFDLCHKRAPRKGHMRYQ